MTDDDNYDDTLWFRRLGIDRPTREMVLDKVNQVFPHSNLEDILSVLDLYGADSYEIERERVQLDILKLSEGKEDKLLDNLEAAKRDLRDVIAWAEYPNFMRIGLVGVDNLDPEGVKDLKERDIHQYLEWFQVDNTESGKTAC